MLPCGVSFVEHQIDVIIREFLQNISLLLCQWLALWGALHRYLSIICYDHVIFNYYFIAVPIRKTCSISLMRFNNRTFYMFHYFTADFKQIFTNLNVKHWNRFLTNIVSKAYKFFLLWKWSLEKRPKYQ